jgi:hypothetical protein
VHQDKYECNKLKTPKQMLILSNKKQHAHIKNKQIDTLKEQGFKQNKTNTKQNLHATHIITKKWNAKIENLIWTMCSQKKRVKVKQIGMLIVKNLLKNLH